MIFQSPIQTNPISGIPCIRLSTQEMWKLREFFFAHEVQTDEQVDDSYITVHFPRLDRGSAQRLVDAWQLVYEDRNCPGAPAKWRN